MRQEAERIAILGSARGGGAAQVVDVLSRCTDQTAALILDSDARSHGQQVFGAPVVGSTSEALLRWEAGEYDAAVIAIGSDLTERERLFRWLRDAGVPISNVVDPSVCIGLGVTMGCGNVILPCCVLGPDAAIGDNCYIISNTAIQHHSVLGDHCYCSTSVAIAGNVRIGDRVRFDTGSGARAKITLGSDLSIPAGVIVTCDLPSGTRLEALSADSLRVAVGVAA